MLPKAINSFAQNYCDFEGDRVYVLMAIARKNENPGITSGTEIVYREVARDEQSLSRYIEKLWDLGLARSAVMRLYLSANARSATDGFFNFFRRQSEWASRLARDDDSVPGKLAAMDSEWISELQRPRNRAETLLLFDYDGDPDKFDAFASEIWAETDIVIQQSTPNGHHLVAEPFNFTELSLDYDYEVKNDGLLFLDYIMEEQ